MKRPRCKAITKEGKQCKYESILGGLCVTHQPIKVVPKCKRRML